MYCTQPAARRLGLGEQAEPTASGHVVGSSTPASAQTLVVCCKGQYGLHSDRPLLHSLGDLRGNPAQLGIQGEHEELLESIKWAR